MTAAGRSRTGPLALLIVLSAYLCVTSAVAADRCDIRQPVAADSLPEPFMENGLWGYRSLSGAVVLSPRFQYAGEFSEYGLAEVFENAGKNWQLIDTAGEPVITPLPFDNGPDPFVEGLARFRFEDRIGFFDARGCVVIKARFDWALPFSEQRAAVCDGCAVVENGEHDTIEGGRWGYVDPAGEIVIPLQYERASSFVDGQAGVESAGDSHFIDIAGNRL